MKLWKFSTVLDPREDYKVDDNCNLVKEILSPRLHEERKFSIGISITTLTHCHGIKIG